MHGPDPGHPHPEALRMLVFDLDGTLIDSLPDIAAAVGEVRQRHGLPPLPDPQIREAIGDGARVLVGRVFSDLGTGADLDRIHAEFIEVYTRRTATHHSPWRRGALALLEGAHAHGTELAILSNKPLALTETILELSGTRPWFREVRGPENSVAPKPDPRALTDLLDDAGVPREAAAFVGDSIVDFGTGRDAGVFTIGVRGGYRADGDPTPDRWFDHPEDLAHWFLGTAREVR